MKTFKIYDESYELEETSSTPPDSYAIDNELVDSPPDGKMVGFVHMEDGSCIQCYKKFKKRVIIIPVCAVAAIGAGFAAYLLFMQPKDVVIPGSEEPIKEGTDTTIISYNAFLSVQDDKMDVNFTNGAEAATVSITVDGVDVETFTAQPYETITDIAAKATTDLGITSGEITISTASSTVTNPIAVEIPKNNMPNGSAASLDGYWKGEHVYEYIPPTPAPEE